MMRLLLLSVMSLSFAVACEKPSVGQTVEDGSQKNRGLTVTTSIPRKENEQPPTLGSVLYFIYMVDGDGATSYEVANGSVATYWFGHEYEIQGRRYFTGFAYNTPEKYGASVEEEFPDPDAKVSLTQATFEMTHPGTEKPWSFLGSQFYIGELGAYERGEVFDGSRKVQSWSEGRRLLLAVPTTWFEQGINYQRYALLLLSAPEDDAEAGGLWKYLGSLEAGSDNSASCVDDDTSCHYSSDGVLSFGDVKEGNLPAIRIGKTGTERLEDGKIVAIQADKADVYHFDEKQGLYVPQ